MGNEEKRYTCDCGADMTDVVLSACKENNGPWPTVAPEATGSGETVDVQCPVCNKWCKFNCPNRG